MLRGSVVKIFSATDLTLPSVVIAQSVADTGPIPKCARCPAGLFEKGVRRVSR